MKFFDGFVHEALMKHALFIIALIVVVIIALRVFFWAFSNVIILAIAAAVIYFGFRFLLGKRKSGSSQ
jgi:1,4-dihydroxy-2-naphthoate octaprenyltransferase